jgi:hypothetical protein
MPPPPTHALHAGTVRILTTDDESRNIDKRVGFHGGGDSYFGLVSSDAVYCGS